MMQPPPVRQKRPSASNLPSASVSEAVAQQELVHLMNTSPLSCPPSSQPAVKDVLDNAEIYKMEDYLFDNYFPRYPTYQ